MEGPLQGRKPRQALESRNGGLSSSEDLFISQHLSQEKQELLSGFRIHCVLLVEKGDRGTVVRSVTLDFLGRWADLCVCSHWFTRSRLFVEPTFRDATRIIALLRCGHQDQSFGANTRLWHLYNIVGFLLGGAILRPRDLWYSSNWTVRFDDSMTTS